MMKTNNLLLVALLFVFCLTSCGKKSSSAEKNKVEEPKKTHATLFDKSLAEVKNYVNGTWELVSCQNATELGEFENTFIVFNNDDYIWKENGKEEPGKLNWRKAPTGAGYDAYLMDVFYAERPSYPLAIKGDTLFIQDCSDTAYKYTLIRK